MFFYVVVSNYGEKIRFMSVFDDPIFLRGILGHQGHKALKQVKNHPYAKVANHLWHAYQTYNNLRDAPPVLSQLSVLRHGATHHWRNEMALAKKRLLRKRPTKRLDERRKRQEDNDPVPFDKESKDRFVDEGGDPDAFDAAAQGKKAAPPGVTLAGIAQGVANAVLGAVGGATGMAQTVSSAPISAADHPLKGLHDEIEQTRKEAKQAKDKTTKTGKKRANGKQTKQKADPKKAETASKQGINKKKAAAAAAAGALAANEARRFAKWYAKGEFKRDSTPMSRTKAYAKMRANEIYRSAPKTKRDLMRFNRKHRVSQQMAPHLRRGARRLVRLDDPRNFQGLP